MMFHERKAMEIPREDSKHGASSSNNEKNKRVRLNREIFDDDIVGDPALRKPISSYPHEIINELRRRYLTRGPCQPRGHNFPITEFGGIRIKFLDEWFTSFDWLEYSVSKDAAYCLWCYLFANEHKHEDDAFTDIGFRDWKKAVEKFQAHEGSANTRHYCAKMMHFGYKDQMDNVDCVMVQKTTQMDDAYRTRVIEVVDVIQYFLKQDLAFCRHNGRSNFLELMRWYCDNNEEVKKVMCASTNNQLISPRVHHQIINACATALRNCSLVDIDVDKRLSLLIGECRDNSRNEHMSVIVRYVSNVGVVTESFLGLVHVGDTSSQSLKNAIDDIFEQNGLSLSRVRSQSYDMTSNMREEFNGLKELILKENEHVYYVHCFAHQLHSIIVDNVSQNAHVSNFFESLYMIVNVVGVPCKIKNALRQRQYDDVAKQLGELVAEKGKDQEMSLDGAGDTRQGSHFKMVNKLLILWKTVRKMFQIVTVDGVDLKDRGLAIGLFEKMGSFEFVFMGYLMKHLLGMTHTLSQVLQLKDQNILLVVQLIRVLKKQLNDFRDCGGWQKLLNDVCTFCIQNKFYLPDTEEIIPNWPRIVANGQKNTIVRYFEDIFLQVIDTISQEIDCRFSELNLELLMGIACLDPSNNFANFDHEPVIRLAELYSNDFSKRDLSELRPQLKIFIGYARSERDFGGLRDIEDLSQTMIKLECDGTFHLVYRLIQLALVLPVTKAMYENERSTAMNIIKTDLHNTMADEFVSDCLTCYIEKEYFDILDPEEVFERFQNMAIEG